jgi:hypothetical protein
MQLWVVLLEQVFNKAHSFSTVIKDNAFLTCVFLMITPR